MVNVCYQRDQWLSTQIRKKDNCLPNTDGQWRIMKTKG